MIIVIHNFCVIINSVRPYVLMECTSVVLSDACLYAYMLYIHMHIYDQLTFMSSLLPSFLLSTFHILSYIILRRILYTKKRINFIAIYLYKNDHQSNILVYVNSEFFNICTYFCKTFSTLLWKSQCSNVCNHFVLNTVNWLTQHPIACFLSIGFFFFYRVQ